MQPFGLLNFLQTLLNSSQQNPPAAPTDTPQENVENAAVDNAENGEFSPPTADSQQAILSFFDAHERRAKNLRK